jgi:hypothetical protein
MEILVSVAVTIVWVISLVGGLLMLIAGFKRNVWWGLAMLFVGPIGMLFFAIKYWEEARLGCLIQIAATAVIVALAFTFPQLLVAMYAEQGFGGLAPSPAVSTQDGASSNSTAVQPLPVPSETPAAAITPPKAAEPKPDPTRKQHAFQDIDFDYLPSEVGRKIRIRTIDGREHEGVVVSAEATSVVLRKRIRGGTMEFSVKKKDVASVEVYEELQ